MSGLVELSWYAKVHGRQVVVAGASVSMNGAAKAALPVKLTKAGKQLLNHASKLKLTVMGVLLPAANPTIAVSEHKAFTLKR